MRLTPRMPVGPAPSSAKRETAHAKAVEIAESQMAGLDQDKMLYLAKKLVHLSILLEQVRHHRAHLIKPPCNHHVTSATV